MKLNFFAQKKMGMKCHPFYSWNFTHGFLKCMLLILPAIIWLFLAVFRLGFKKKFMAFCPPDFSTFPCIWRIHAWKKGEVQFHSTIDLSDKNLINLLYKLLKQSKRNELTWYIQHWLLLSKNRVSVLSATTAAIQFFRNKFFLLLVSHENKETIFYSKKHYRLK